jgi:hypothetical protein
VRSKRQAFEEAIIVLVIRLSPCCDGRWFAVQDMQALLVAGEIKNELLNDKHVMMFSISRSRNDAWLVDNRHGRRSSVQQMLEAVAPHIDKTFGKDSKRAITCREEASW